jgi:hypothetical protein
MVPVQGLLRWEHLPAQSDKEPVQDAQGAQGRVDAAGSGGALKTLALVKKKNYTSKAQRKEQKLVFKKQVSVPYAAPSKYSFSFLCRGADVTVTLFGLITPSLRSFAL